MQHRFLLSKYSLLNATDLLPGRRNGWPLTTRSERCWCSNWRTASNVSRKSKRKSSRQHQHQFSHQIGEHESATDGQHSAVGAGRSCGADSDREGRRVVAWNCCQTTHATGSRPRTAHPRHTHHGPRREFPVVGRQTGGFEGRFCRGGRCWGSRIVKDGTRCPAVDSVDASTKNDRRRVRLAGSFWRGEVCSVLSVASGVMRRWFLSVNAKYGLRGVRIGEAANPGPAGRHRRAQRLRALRWSWGSDTSNEEGRHVVRRLDAQSIDTDPLIAQSSSQAK